MSKKLATGNTSFKKAKGHATSPASGSLGGKTKTGLNMPKPKGGKGR